MLTELFLTLADAAGMETGALPVSAISDIERFGSFGLLVAVVMLMARWFTNTIERKDALLDKSMTATTEILNRHISETLQAITEFRAELHQHILADQKSNYEMSHELESMNQQIKSFLAGKS